MTTRDHQLNEPILPDDYPVYASYAYVVDGEPIVSDIEGTVAHLKVYMKAREVRRYDLVERQTRALLSSETPNE